MAGRPKGYNRDKIIEIAKNLFWEKGYAGASLADLIHAMGVSKSTFYSAFESKDHLFKICLESYGRSFFRDMVNCVTRHPTVMVSLKDYFMKIALEQRNFPPAKGCLLVSSANEIGLSHSYLSPVVHELMRVARSTLKNALELAVRKRELPSSFACDAGAIYLMGQMFGLRTLVKSGLPAEELAVMVETVFAQLPELWKGKSGGRIL